MKVLYIITKSNWGGAQRHVFDVAVNARAKGHEVVVALGGNGPLNDRLIAEGIQTRSIGSMGRDVKVGADAVSFGDIYKIIKNEKPDVLHLHSPKAAGLGALAGRLKGVQKIIYTVHGWAFNENRPWHQKVAIAFFSWITMLLCTDIITISEKELGQTRAFPLVLKKTHMLYLGISAPKFATVAEAKAMLQSKTTETLDKKIIIGTIAELHPNKGHVYTINAIAKLLPQFPNLMYFIISDGEQREMLERLIAEKKLGKHVVLAGSIPNAAQYIKAFSIFLLPSLKEGLPYTLIEAGFAALPVISTTVGGIPEIVDDMHSGILIQPKKSDEIAHAIQFLLEHKDTMKDYGKELHEKVTETFRLETMLEKTFQLYN